MHQSEVAVARVALRVITQNLERLFGRFVGSPHSLADEFQPLLRRLGERRDLADVRIQSSDLVSIVIIDIILFLSEIVALRCNDLRVSVCMQGSPGRVGGLGLEPCFLPRLRRFLHLILKTREDRREAGLEGPQVRLQRGQSRQVRGLAHVGQIAEQVELLDRRAERLGHLFGLRRISLFFFVTIAPRARLAVSLLVPESLLGDHLRLLQEPPIDLRPRLVGENLWLRKRIALVLEQRPPFHDPDDEVQHRGARLQVALDGAQLVERAQAESLGPAASGRAVHVVADVEGRLQHGLEGLGVHHALEGSRAQLGGILHHVRIVREVVQDLQGSQPLARPGALVHNRVHEAISLIEAVCLGLVEGLEQDLLLVRREEAPQLVAQLGVQELDVERVERVRHGHPVSLVALQVPKPAEGDVHVVAPLRIDEADLGDLGLRLLLHLVGRRVLRVLLRRLLRGRRREEPLDLALRLLHGG
eukprot:scaffold1880_cov211-Pinguiococcus_pyrenoidosus.AAC.2